MDRRQRVENWWSTMNKMSQAEVDFQQMLDAGDHISTRGRAMLLSRDSKNVQICKTPEELLDNFSFDIEGNALRELTQPYLLIVLEDLSRGWVEALGPSLNIPVSVFALHWANPIDHVGGAVRVPIGESPARHFILNYRQSLPFSIQKDITVDDMEIDIEHRLDCNVVRPITSRSKKYKGCETSDQLVTYYATGPTGKNPVYPSILLLDPMTVTPESLHKVIRPDNGREEILRKPAICVPRYCPAILPLSNPDAATKMFDLGSPATPKYITPQMSLFDELLDVVDFARSHSLNLTYKIRRLVLARNVTAINSLLQETIQLTSKASIGVTKIADFNFETFEQRAWVDEWRGDFFSQLWVLREDLEYQGYKLQQNLRVVNRIAAITGNDQDAKIWGKELKSVKEQEMNDLLEWSDLEKLRLYTFKIMERTTESYLQTVQATGAQFANIQAKSVRRLTGLVSLFVPASLCAAVLAIPNFGGSDKNQKFWIFWVVSVPIVIILMVFFFTSLPKKISGRWKEYQQRHQETPLPAYMSRRIPVKPSRSPTEWLKIRRKPEAPAQARIDVENIVNDPTSPSSLHSDINYEVI